MSSLNRAPPAEVNFADPVHLYFLNRARGTGLSAYLVALAAYQRGLEVTFHYELRTQCPRFARLAVQGYRGELLSISDGTQRVHFYRALCERVSRTDSMMCEDKQATKERWQAGGVDVAAGVLVNRSDLEGVQTLLAHHNASHFIIKPVNGSLGRGVHRHVARDDLVHRLREAFEKGREQRLLVEEEITGREYRVYVIDGRFLYAHERLTASVTGDGRSTIEALVSAQNALRLRHPSRYVYPFHLTPEMHAFLANQGLSAKTIPAKGLEVKVFDVRSQDQGGNNMACVDGFPERIQRLCEIAQRTLGVNFVGLDLIVAQQGTDDERVVFLEANQNPHLSGSVLSPDFQSWGNTMAEALIDHHFPNSVHNPRWCMAAFDMQVIKDTLSSSMVDSVKLPVLTKQTVVVRKMLANAHAAQQIRQWCQHLGLHGSLLPVDKARSVFYMVDSKEHVTQLGQRLGVDWLP